MYRQRRHRRRKTGSFESYKAEREIERQKHRRSDKTVFGLIIFAAVGLFIAFELGRTFLYMQSVKSFASSIESLPPAAVKTEVQRFARGLYSPNPLIRNGAVAALKIATGWNVGTDVDEWIRRWASEEPYWQYRSRTATNLPARPVIDWRKELPSGGASPP